MTLIMKSGSVEIWLIDGEYYVYGVTSDPRVAHSEGAARAIAASAVGL
ncbi:hypothetical protein GG804_26010 [Sphingomonas histidinilytica]|jgi:hypothetical protein|nr:hypothetical protein [Rhizorhabdus histidinilytica]MBO9380225.1 hypothetical protein [Rhizorhabdus histidinilytica]